jgi:hypothetical protein
VHSSFQENPEIPIEFIVFPKRGNTIDDKVNDKPGGTSNNDILFLSNFNEKYSDIWDIYNFPTNVGELFNSLEVHFNS